MESKLEEKTTFEWPPLESGPEIFTNYMHKIGLSDKWGIGEVFGFDEDLLAFLPQPILSTILCYEGLKKTDERQLGSPENNGVVPFYQRQTGTLDNACGIIACLHSVLNKLDQVEVSEGSILDKFNQAAKGKTPEERATLLENANDFKAQHASMA